jgi:alpha-tubulin suppressor-like RCC1 family protein
VNGQADEPEPDEGFMAAAAGDYHSLGLKADGRIIAWGDNTYGQTAVPGTNADFVAVGGGYYHSLGLKSDGRVIGWGNSLYGQTAVPLPNAGFGQQSGIMPPRGPVSGDTKVTILGSNLGNGTDVTNVVLCGVPATIITQNTWVVVVKTASAAMPTNGAVVVYSAGYGRITQTNSFSYYGPPTVMTRGVTNITMTNAVGAGEVPMDGGDTVLERGLCWGVATNPTLSDLVAVSGSGTGVFAGVTMTNLSPGLRYHVRAWARNLAGVSYGADVPFLTQYAIMASAGSHGTISPGGVIPVVSGSNVTFTITPDAGYQITDLQVDAGPVHATNRYTFLNVMGNHTIVANFWRIGPWRGADSIAAGGYHSLWLKSDGRILTCGYNNLGQTNVPPPNADFVAVAAGEYHSLGLKADGRVIGWGWDNYGQVIVPLPNTAFVAVSAGLYHSLGLKSDGHIVAWGGNIDGQAVVPGTNADFVAVAAGGNHSLGLKSSGRIMAWGNNTYGQTAVPGTNAGFVAVSAGGNHSLGLKSDGRIIAWGNNAYGQAAAPGSNVNFVAVSAGGNHSLGLKSDGHIVAWGNGLYGQTAVPEPNANFVAVAAGGNHSLGLKSDGSLIAWGDNTHGQTNILLSTAGFGQLSGIVPPGGPLAGGTTVTILGVNLGNGMDVTNVTLCGAAATVVTQGLLAVVVQTAPAPLAVPTNGDVVVYSAGYGHITRTNGFTYYALPAVLTRGVTNITMTNAAGAGEVLTDAGDTATERGLCWGLATNPTLSDAVAASGLGAGVFPAVMLENLSPGTVYHVRAWARNMGGLIYGADVPFKTRYGLTASAGAHGAISPVGLMQAPDEGSVTFTITVDSGYEIKDVLVDDVSVGVTNGYTFSNVTSNHTIRVNFWRLDPSRRANPVAAGLYYSLGLKSDGRIVAWGDGSYGQTNVPGTNVDVVALAAGGYHALALTLDGHVVAWGMNDYGQTNVPGTNADFVAVAAGEYHSLGLKSDGHIVGWGMNGDGQRTVPAPNSDFVAIAAGGNHSLGLKSDGRIIAWGDNRDGQTAVPAPNADFVAVAAGRYHSLGLKSDGRVIGWGYNIYDQTIAPAPNADFIAVAAGGYHSLGLKSDGHVVCWGMDDYGQSTVPAPNADFVALAGGGYHSLGLTSDGRLIAWGMNDYSQTVVPLPNTGFVRRGGYATKPGFIFWLQ